MFKIQKTYNLLQTASGSKWQRIGTRRRSGIVVPLFSVYSHNSIGIGDLEDLRLVIDWAAKTGNTILQLLPMNEVSGLFCPYDSISSFALEPMYICLNKIPFISQDKIKDKLRELKQRFPVGLSHVDYGIKAAKLNLLWQIFLEEEKVWNHPELKEFIQKNRYWIEDFALYQVLKQHHAGRAWYEWEQVYRKPSVDHLENFKREHQKEVIFHIWLQWLLYRQFKEIKNYAKTKNVLIKGDLPVLVSRDSADVWQHPGFFKLEYASGAPPDMYCAKGQRWGMPTYNWDNIAQDNYRYIKEKLRYAEEFYDILRIDHVVGLFRIWSIPYSEPLENKGLNGFFDPAEESKWAEQGKTILSTMLKSTNMLLCAEDLGVIPKVCTETLRELGIPGNDVQRWSKDWQITHDFLKPSEYRYVSVAMLSTHDTTNWPAWWENEAATVDEALFIRKCNERKIDYEAIKDKLFDFSLSRHGRLRWLDSLDSMDKLVEILKKPKEEVVDFIDMYKNTYQEKEKLWRQLDLPGKMREKSDPEIVKAALQITLDSKSIFCINTIIDWLYLTDVFKGDPYQYRFNTPGTISPKNWSMIIPIYLEDLLTHSVNKIIKDMLKSSDRI